MEFSVRGFEFRVKKLNSIRILAIRSQADFSSVDKAEAFFSSLLECLEVRSNECWLEVKAKNNPHCIPVELETNPLLVKEVCEAFTEQYLYPLFHESRE